MNYNYIALAGNLTRDVQLSYTPSQVEVAEFGMAINKKYKGGLRGKDKETVCFVDCVAFQKNAVNINKYLKKGDALFVSGELQLDTWEKDGQKRSKHKVLVQSFEFVGGKKESQGSVEQGAPEIPF